MANFDEQIEIARRPVREGRRIVQHQRERMATKNVSHDAADLLATFERTLTPPPPI